MGEWISEDLTRYIRELLVELQEVNNKIDILSTRVGVLEEGIKNFYSAVHSEIRRLNKRVEGIEAGIRGLNERVSEVEDRLNDVSQRVGLVEKRLNKVEGRINDVERRVEKAEENLNRRLEEQDKVLESHSEALLDNIAFQVMSAIRSKYGSLVSLTLAQMDKNPLIIVEDHRSISLIAVTEKANSELYEILRRLKERAELYTDKEVLYKILTAEVSMRTRGGRAGEPVWTFIAEGAY